MDIQAEYGFLTSYSSILMLTAFLFYYGLNNHKTFGAVGTVLKKEEKKGFGFDLVWIAAKAY